MLYVCEHVLNSFSNHISFNKINCRNTRRLCFNNEKRLQTPLSVHSWVRFYVPMLGSFFGIFFVLFFCSFVGSFWGRFGGHVGDVLSAEIDTKCVLMNF